VVSHAWQRAQRHMLVLLKHQVLVHLISHCVCVAAQAQAATELQHLVHEHLRAAQDKTNESGG
jgi:hypothetical protein